MNYDPKTAARALRKHQNDSLPRTDKPTGIVTSKGEPTYAVKKRPETFAMPLRAFAEYAAALPADFRDVERSGAGLKAHTRPDGGVYIGAFDMPDDASNTILVFGDPLMPLDVAKHVSILFRRKLMQLAETDARARKSDTPDDPSIIPFPTTAPTPEHAS